MRGGWRVLRLPLLPILLPVAVLGIRKQWWSIGYAAELCGLPYYTFVRVCSRLRIKVITLTIEEVTVG